MSPPGRRKTNQDITSRAEPYRHPEADGVLRPEVGTQPYFKKKKLPAAYQYDSSLSPALDWDGQNPAREQGEALIREILEAQSLEAAKSAAAKLKLLSKPFLNWTGKAERLSFSVPTLPLFVHERLSTKSIIETLKGHRKDHGLRQLNMSELFGDPRRSISDQVLKAYEYRDRWVNRMVLGDSLVVMNSLLQYESLGGQVQMIFMDPPYGVKFGSNFQPFVRKRDVTHNDDDDFTREPEMVKAYRDTWVLGLHSYLSYLRDRLLLCRELLAPTGSIFVQISDKNLHHVREVMDEIFGAENLVGIITLKKTHHQESVLLPCVADYLIWYARDKERMKYRPYQHLRKLEDVDYDKYRRAELPDGTICELTEEERDNPSLIPLGHRPFRDDITMTQDGETKEGQVPFELDGKVFFPGHGRHWRTGAEGRERLKQLNRVVPGGDRPFFKAYWDDTPLAPINNIWSDLSGTQHKLYVVQTNARAIQRCILMSSDPGDLVLDPTCGSGTTAYVAEQWGRRWITIDVSRVPLALARQRLLTATFPWYQLKDESRGPAGGFVYVRKQNKKGEEVGGIVPHITLKSIANNEPPQEEVLVDRPESDSKITRVSGPFVVEATIPTPMDWEGTGEDDRKTQETSTSYGSFVERMLEVLRRSPVLHVGGGKTVVLKNVRPPAKSLSLSAECMLAENGEQPVALVFGPENGAVSEKLIFEAAREAYAKSYRHLYVIGFAIQPNGRQLVETCEATVGISATYVQATPDLMMGDLLKNMRSSQIFSVCGLPEITISRIEPMKKNEETTYQVELLGLDVFDPVTMDVDHRKGADLPAWLLDTDYNGLCFHVCQAFFPRTGAWESLKKALRATHEESVWDHLAGAVSAPFGAGEHGQVAVKVIDDRGNELLVVKSLKEAAP